MLFIGLLGSDPNRISSGVITMQYIGIVGAEDESIRGGVGKISADRGGFVHVVSCRDEKAK
jgi:hypothetical protein